MNAGRAGERKLSKLVLTMEEVSRGRCKVQTKNYKWRNGDDDAEDKRVLNLELEYEVLGKDTDPAVLLIHG